MSAAALTERAALDEQFQAACQQYAHGNGSSQAIAAAALLAVGVPGLVEIVRLSIGNVRSLGPAGALAHVHAPYQEWLLALESAYAKVQGEQP